MTGLEILAGIGLFASVAGGAITYMGQQQAAAAQRNAALQAAEAQRQQLEYTAKVAENNRTLAERAAADAEARGDVAEAAQRRQAEALKGRQRAVLAGSGVLLDDGTPLDIISDTSQLGEVDALTVRSNAQREALGFRTQGIDFQNEANLNRLGATNAAAQGQTAASNISSAASIQGVSTILGTAGSVAKQWYNFSAPPTTRSWP